MPAPAAESGSGSLAGRILGRVVDLKRAASTGITPLKKAILWIALTGFLAGAVWSVSKLGIEWRELQYPALFYCVLLLAPSLWLNAAELQLCASAAGTRIGVFPALSVSSWATIANLLPLPAGALLRGAALTRSGASAVRSGAILVLAAILWLGLAVAVTTLVVSRSPASIALASVAAAIVIAVACWIARIGRVKVAVGLVAVRVGLLALTIGRLYYCFEALGYPAGFAECAAYASASVVGTMAGIAPAGIGVTEGVGAALAALLDQSPAAAFLALGVNRLIGLAGAALLSAYCTSRVTSGQQSSKGT